MPINADVRAAYVVPINTNEHGRGVNNPSAATVKPHVNLEEAHGLVYFHILHSPRHSHRRR